MLLLLLLMNSATAASPQLLTAISVAAKAYAVSEDKLLAIAMVESGGQLKARRENKNGTVDVGPMQINSIHWGSTCADYRVHTAEGNVMCAAKIVYQLRKRWAKRDADWIGRYHSGTPGRKERYKQKLDERMTAR